MNAIETIGIAIIIGAIMYAMVSVMSWFGVLLGATVIILFYVVAMVGIGIYNKSKGY